MQHHSIPRYAFLGTLVLAVIAAPVAAHSPSNIVLSYDPAAGMLTATITHSVPNPAAHYVKEVGITVNGASDATVQYTSQPAPDTFTYTYPLQASAGSTIAVRAVCSIQGELTRSIVVAEATPTTPPAVTPGTVMTTPTESGTATMTSEMTTPATVATTPPATTVPATAQAPGFALWAGVLGVAAAGYTLALRR